MNKNRNHDAKFTIKFSSVFGNKDSIIPKRAGIWKIQNGLWWLQIDISLKRPEIYYCGSGRKVGIGFYDPDKKEGLGIEVFIGINGNKKDELILFGEQVKYGWEGIILLRKKADNLGANNCVLVVEAKKKGNKWCAKNTFVREEK